VARFIGDTNLFDGTVLSAAPTGKFDPDGLPVLFAELDIPELGRIKVTTVDRVEPGQTVSFTVRPEKIKISTGKPAIKREDINLFRGFVDEPVYSGFQTKFYVKTGEQAMIRVLKQHANYSDEGPEIVWKDEVCISWSADDGYIVEVKEKA
jgi:spermidine/putrescine transport system ATP-binding protein